MYIHMFAFRMKPGVTDSQKERMLTEIRALEAQIPEILESWVGMNESAHGQGYELGGAMRFRDKGSFEKYGPHPAHQKLVNWLVPLIDSVEVDFPF
jgi:hypothetical protein